MNNYTTRFCNAYNLGQTDLFIGVSGSCVILRNICWINIIAVLEHYPSSEPYQKLTQVSRADRWTNEPYFPMGNNKNSLYDSIHRESPYNSLWNVKRLDWHIGHTYQPEESPLQDEHMLYLSILQHCHKLLCRLRDPHILLRLQIKSFFFVLGVSMFITYYIILFH